MTRLDLDELIEQEGAVAKAQKAVNVAEGKGRVEDQDAKDKAKARMAHARKVRDEKRAKKKAEEEQALKDLDDSVEPEAPPVAPGAAVDAVAESKPEVGIVVQPGEAVELATVQLPNAGDPPAGTLHFGLPEDLCGVDSSKAIASYLQQYECLKTERTAMREDGFRDSEREAFKEYKQMIGGGHRAALQDFFIAARRMWLDPQRRYPVAKAKGVDLVALAPDE